MRFILSVLVAASAVAADPAPVANPQVDLHTSKGVIRCELFASEAPETVANFIGLAEGTKPWTDPKTNAKQTKPFYDGLVFHRVIKGFMIQGGCPLGQGTSGPGYQFRDEINAVALGLDKELAVGEKELHPWCGYMMQQFRQVMVFPRMQAHGITEKSTREEQMKVFPLVQAELKTATLKDFYEALGYRYDPKLPGSHKPVKGSLAMANSGPGTNGSQFFINLGDTPHLTGKHTVFGQVIEGHAVVEALGSVPVGAQDKPVEPVTIIAIRTVGSTVPLPGKAPAPSIVPAPPSAPAPELAAPKEAAPAK